MFQMNSANAYPPTDVFMIEKSIEIYNDGHQF